MNYSYNVNGTKEDAMISRISRHFAVRAAIVLALVLLAGCAHTKFEDKYTPGAREVSLWGSEIIPIGPEWKYIGVENVTIRGEVWNSPFASADQIQTMVFVRETASGPAALLLSRVVKTGEVEIFNFLGGSKTTLGDRIYREHMYGLSSQTTDPEYRRYFEKLRSAGFSPASGYDVRVLDRLPLDTVLVRIMELTPGQATSELPGYGKLYPQERLEIIRRPFN